MRTGKAESDVNVPSMSTACDDCGKIHKAAAQNGRILDIDCMVFGGWKIVNGEKRKRIIRPFSI